MSPQQKVPNLSNRGSLTIPSPLAFAEGLFSFYNFYKKEGFLKDLSYNGYKFNNFKNLFYKIIRNLFVPREMVRII